LSIEFWSTSFEVSGQNRLKEKQPASHTHLLLHQRQLLQIPFQERHLLLLSLAVAVPDDIVVLLFDFVQLNFEIDNLPKSNTSDTYRTGS